jgi:arabinose-5-phosphate isomerase
LKPKTHLLKNNHDKVVDFLRIEAGAIERSASTLDRESVEAAVELIACCDKKIVVTGVGKSGVIAQKIAQTLTSTGTMAVFVHPSDAIHGGLGVIAAGDVVIALSNSGETDEIITILPAILRRGSSLIAVVGNSDSTLARKAHVVLDASVDKEACPLNLAPTTSTTVALAIGDAIAMTVMEAKGLTAEAFAANHPGGQLGKRLTLTVGDLMHPSPDIEPDATWLDVVKALSQHALGALSVVDGDKGLLGIITEGDLRRSIEKSGPSELPKLTAADMMNRTPTTTNSETLAFEALQLMENRPFQISVLPVVDGDGRASGLLRLHDIVRSGL